MVTNLELLLRGMTLPLYALIDAARDQSILPLLRSSLAPRACLFEGEHAQTLATHAAYLVRLIPGEPLLATLVRRGWGHSWGVYLTSDQPFDALLAQLRRRDWVRDPGGKKLYFRFFDPRVLRTTLAAMDQTESSDFLGLVRSYIVEADPPEAMRCWSLEGGRVHDDTVQVSV
jgi:hypothetical protein